MSTERRHFNEQSGQRIMYGKRCCENRPVWTEPSITGKTRLDSVENEDSVSTHGRGIQTENHTKGVVFILAQRVNGVYYALVSQRLTSLKTREEAEAKRLIAAKNRAADTPQLNRAMAKVYASAASPQLMERTWREVMDA